MPPEVDPSRTAFREGSPQDTAKRETALRGGEATRAEVNV
jgi:hypothetical protein